MLTSSVTTILRAMTDKFFWDQVLGWSQFFINFFSFSLTRERVLVLTDLALSYVHKMEIIEKLVVYVNIFVQDRTFLLTQTISGF